jgi:hypothetical protein
MSSQQFDANGGDGARKPGDRMEHEPRVGDPRPREVKRNHTAFGLLALGFVVGAALFALGVWIVSLIADRHYSTLVYIVAAVIGGGIGLGLFPYVSLARSDGADASIVKNRGRRGRADAPIEGAEAIDEGRVPRTAGHPR